MLSHIFNKLTFRLGLASICLFLTRYWFSPRIAYLSAFTTLFSMTVFAFLVVLFRTYTYPLLISLAKVVNPSFALLGDKRLRKLLHKAMQIISGWLVWIAILVLIFYYFVTILGI